MESIIVRAAVVALISMGGSTLAQDSPSTFPLEQVIEAGGMLRAITFDSEYGDTAFIESVSMAAPIEVMRSPGLPGLQVAGYLANPFSWSRQGNSTYYLSVTRTSIHQEVRGASIVEIPDDQMDRLREQEHLWDHPRFPSLAASQVTVASGGPLGPILTKIQIGFRQPELWFHTVFHRNGKLAEQYVIIDGALSRWELPRAEYEEGERIGRKLVPELQAIQEARGSVDPAIISPEDRDTIDDYPMGFPTYWRKIAEYPAPFDGPFHAIPIDNEVYLLNINGEVYRIDEAEVVKLGQFENWPAIGGAAQSRAIILFENSDEDTASVLDVSNGSIHHLPFNPVSPEHNNPFQTSKLPENKQQAIVTLVQAMKTNSKTPAPPPVSGESP